MKAEGVPREVPRGRAFSLARTVQTGHHMGLTGAALLSSVPAEEQAEFQQLSDEIQELQQLLNQDFRQKTVCVLADLHSEKSVSADGGGSAWTDTRQTEARRACCGAQAASVVRGRQHWT